jgi:membrane protease YdiL (CAAX protease family)/NAD-dependent dihydropyrimidine dehydrogenase PreA subunit
LSSSAHLTLRPDRCIPGCSECVSACPKDAVRVGDGYILVDWHACDQCCCCVEACPAQAIQREIMPKRAAATGAAPVAPADVAKVRVGSRAEAKAVRKAAEQAARQAAKSSGKPAPVTRLFGSDAGSAESPSHAAPASSSWGWVDAVAVLALLALTIVGKNAIFAIPALALMPAGARALTRAAVLAAYYGVQIGALVLLAGRHATSFASAFRLGAGDESQPGGLSGALISAGLVGALLVGVEVVALGYGLGVQALGWRQPVSLSSDVASVFGGGGLGVVLAVVLVALVAPVAEELAFRGVILSALEGLGLGMWPAIGISAVVFAVYHLNAWLFVPMTALGVALGWLARSRKTLWPAIALHVLYNGLAVAAAFLVPLLPK